MEAIHPDPVENLRESVFLLVAATPWQRRGYRLLEWLLAPLRLPERIGNSRALRRRAGVYDYIRRKAAANGRCLRRFVHLPTFAGDYCFLIGVEEIRGLMQFPRLGQGELIGEGRQLYVVADALGRFPDEQGAPGR